eukprot:c24271_g5_i2 orf=2011-3195(+)
MRCTVQAIPETTPELGRSSLRPPCSLLLHRNHSLPSTNPNSNLNDETPMHCSVQASPEATPELGNYGFDRPGKVTWSKDLWGTLELCGKLEQDVTLYYSSFGTPMAKSMLNIGEGNVWLALEFKRDLALVAAAYLVKNDCVLVSGKLRCSVQDTYWIVQAHDVKYVQTEHHNGHIPEGFVRAPQMTSLSEEGLQARWREFFEDPSLWHDNRAEKVCRGQPDFEHKTLGYGLWVNGYRIPRWVHARLQKYDATHDDDDDDVNACKDGSEPCHQHGKLVQVDKPFGYLRTPKEESASMRVTLWRDLFENPSNWFDCRHQKQTLKSPDFQHKSTHAALWICSWETPSWVLRQLAIRDSNAPTSKGSWETPPWVPGQLAIQDSNAQTTEDTPRQKSSK